MSTKGGSFWIPYADLMTVLMVLFLFISISYMAMVQKKFSDYSGTRTEIYNELDSVFKNDFQRWNIVLEEDLSIKFTNPQVLFESGKDEINPTFQNTLEEFIPKYISVINKPKYKDAIAEVRIEGHTDNKKITDGRTGDPFIDNMELSQSRARNVLAFFRNTQAFNKLNQEDKEKLTYLVTANGLSYGRMLNDNDSLSYKAKSGKISQNKSRRVEFRIISATDKILSDKIKK